MRAARSIAGPNGGRIEIRELPDLKPGEGQIVIRVRASGLNRSEIGRLQSHRNGEPAAVGIECAGEVAAAGVGVTKVRIGDRVMCRCSGSHAGMVVVNQRAAMPVPAGMSWTDAASLPNTCVTAHDALTASADLQSGESVLINAASSGVGTAAIQIARLLGGTPIIGTTSSPAKVERLEQIGLDVAILTSDDLNKAVRAATGDKGADVAIDNVGASVTRETVRAMAYKGRMVQVGRLEAAVGEIDLDLLAMKRVRLIGTSFRMRSAEESLQASEAFERALLPAVATGRLRPIVDRVFSLEELPRAYDYMSSNQQIGKIVLSV
jgi:NADPH:quinone reductase